MSLSGREITITPTIITTNTTGMATFTVSDNTAETITINLTSDGTGGTTSLPGVNGQATATFTANPYPTMSSASDLIFVTGNAANQPVITISANGGTRLAGLNTVKITIPASLSANFSATAPDAVLTAGTGGTVGAPTVLGNIVTIPITGTLSTNAVITVGSTTPISYTSTNSPSSGSLQLSVDGGSTSYTTGWDGKNHGGRIVARGIYFIRVVGTGIRRNAESARGQVGAA